jgi:hypothetical protein
VNILCVLDTHALCHEPHPITELHDVLETLAAKRDAKVWMCVVVEPGKETVKIFELSRLLE